MKNKNTWWKLIDKDGATHESADIRKLQIKQPKFGGFIFRVSL